MKLKNLGELKKVYNFQNTVILCEIFEQRSSQLQKLFKYNPKKCYSASSFSGCVHRDKSKCLIALPTEAEHFRVFEKTLIGRFSCVNTRLAFDSQILLSNKENEKLVFGLKINEKEQIERTSTKLLKMDENNQYGQAMTKPLAYGCIKKMETVPILLEFNKILDGISHEDTIGHLFIVDINFHNKNPKPWFLTKYIRLFLKKNKNVNAYERSIIQLMSILSRNKERDIINSFRCTAKTHSTLDEKKIIPLYAEHLYFLIKRAGWLMTPSYLL